AKRKDCSIKISYGPSRTTPAPLPHKFDASSTESVQGCKMVLSGGEVNSRTKSAKTCDLILPLGI
ncbi:hypothetical protein A2U01_0048241, partial [Trifolium medium]|nr:hypothetical protein [Trifolium medium]